MKKFNKKSSSLCLIAIAVFGLLSCSQPDSSSHTSSTRIAIPVSKTTYTGYGNDVSYYEVKYDSKNNLLMQKEYYADPDSYIYKLEFEYNSNNQRTIKKIL